MLETILFTIDESSPLPKYRQIMDRLIEKMESGILFPGEKLPSTRVLAQTLGVHRSTVSLAYQELWALGYIELERGACPKVRHRVPLVPKMPQIESSGMNWESWASQETRDLVDTYKRYHGDKIEQHLVSENWIDFRRTLDERLFPVEGFRSILNRLTASHGAELLNYGAPEGYGPLRSYLADHMRRYGLAVSEEEVLITNGAQQGLELVLRMMAAPGKRVAVETPTYRELIPVIRYYGMEILEIPMKSDGMDLDYLEKIASQSPIDLIYTMPNFHNPSGISTGQRHRERLLSIAEHYGIPILEDGFQEEMKYFGKAVLPIKSMDRSKMVIYCGTFSKVLFPGTRIGWLIASPEAIGYMTAHRFFSEMVPGQLLQAAIYEFCQSGAYDRHVSRMHRVFRKRMETLLKELRQKISKDWARWDEPSGGYLVWLNLKINDGEQLKQLIQQAELGITFGEAFFPTQRDTVHIRLSIAGLNEAEISRGVARLAQVLKTMVQGSEEPRFQEVVG